MNILGIDIGGSGVKGAVVDTKTGDLVTDRLRLPTPESGDPEGILRNIGEIMTQLEYKGPVGCGFPGVILDNTIHTAANLHDKWIGTNLRETLKASTGCDATAINDADAAGLAEIRLGAGKDSKGLVIVITIGTGLGTGFFYNGSLIPNSEFGHMPLRGDEEAEAIASEAARKQNDLSWSKWGNLFDAYLERLENLLWPELFILGGGGIKKSKPDKFMPHLNRRTPIALAEFKNNAGIIGAAMAAFDNLH